MAVGQKRSSFAAIHLIVFFGSVKLTHRILCALTERCDSFFRAVEKKTDDD